MTGLAVSVTRVGPAGGQPRDAEEWGGRWFNMSSAAACAGLVLVYKGRAPSHYLEVLTELKPPRRGWDSFPAGLIFPNGVL